MHRRARQHAARARAAVEAAAPPPRVRSAAQRDVLAAFADALARADLPALLRVLHPDVVLLNDSDGRVRAARRPVHGADKVARLLLGLLDRYGPALLDGGTGWSTATPAWSPSATAPSWPLR